jgi:hypothetical protein
MIRKLLAVAATVAAVALVVGVSRASADSIVAPPTAVPTAQPDLVVTGVTRSIVSVTNKRDAAYPTTATAGAFRVRVSRWHWGCALYNTFVCYWMTDPTVEFTLWWLPPDVTVTYKYAPDAAYAEWVYVEVDPLEQVVERDETNNTYSALAY